jgi:AraC-like DNA-binding protein
MQYLFENKKKGMHYQVFEEILQCPNVTTIGASSYTTGMRAIPREVHKNSFEIHYIDRGHQLFVVDDRLIPLKAGEFLVVSPNQVHGPAHGIILPSKIYWVRIRAEFPAGFSKDESALITNHLKGIAGRPCTESTPFIRAALDTILHLLGSDKQDLGTRMTLKHNELAMISALLNLKPQQNLNPKQALVIERIGKTIDKMNIVTEKHYTVPDLAKECHIGETLYRRIFKEVTGFSPVDFIHFTRMEKAIRLLKQGKSVTETAYDLGYSSSQHFSRTFTKWTGESPSSYKLQTNQVEQVVSRSSDQEFYRKLSG